jgi:hypothetical protein
MALRVRCTGPLLVVAFLSAFCVGQAKDKKPQYEKAKVKSHDLSIIGGSAYGRLCQQDNFNLELDGWMYSIWSQPKCNPSKFQKVDPFPADYVQVHRLGIDIWKLGTATTGGRMVVLDKEGNEHTYLVLGFSKNGVDAPLPQGTTVSDSSASSVQAPSGGTEVVNPQSQSAAATLGLEVTTSEQGGVEIVKIDPDGAAALGGLQVGEVITSVDGKRVRNVTDLATALAGRMPGSKVRVNYMFHNVSFGWMPGAEKVLILGSDAN